MEHLLGTSDKDKEEIDTFERDWDWNTAHCTAYIYHLRVTKDQYFVDMAIEALEKLGIDIPRELDLMNNNSI